MERRRRSNALHADSQEEYLEKLETLDSNQPAVSVPQRAFSLDDRSFRDFDYTEVSFVEQEPEELEDLPTQQEYHRILVFSDDMRLSHSKINELLEHVCGSEGLSQSTSEEVKPYLTNTNEVLPLDIYIIKRIIKQTQHVFQFWIQNTIDHQSLSLFEETYYSGFKAMVHLSMDGNLISKVKGKLLHHNPNVKFFTLTRDCDYCCTPFKKVKLENSLKNSFMCGSFSEVVDKLLF